MVFGATGFIGRWTVLHLLEQGRMIAAVVREPARSRTGAGTMSREGELRARLQDHGVATERPAVVAGDFTSGTDVLSGSFDAPRLATAHENSAPLMVLLTATERIDATGRSPSSTRPLMGIASVCWWDAYDRLVGNGTCG